ncbi:MAG: hypothetical protein ACUVS3_01700 [Thermodesulfobacteriota bacterium]
MKRPFLIFMGLLLVMVCGGVSEARITLVALPQREATLVRLDNPAFTLVEEERVLALQNGINAVEFSWKGVTIDEDSISLHVLDHPDEVRLISVSFPPGEAALVWQIHSPMAYNERLRITYLLANMDRLVTHEGLVSQDESIMELKSYLVLRNFSGETLMDATVQLDYGESFQTSIHNQETKRMLFFSKSGLPNEKTIHWNDQKQPWDPEKQNRNVSVPVFYTLYNTKEKGLGEHTLWGGKIRVFQEDGRGSTILLGEDTVDLVAVGETLRVSAGESRDVVVTQRKLREEKIVKERNNSGVPILWDTEEILEARIENFKDKPALLILTEHIPGQWDMKACSHKYELKDFQTLEFKLALAPKEKVTLNMQYQRRNLR